MKFLAVNLKTQFGHLGITVFLTLIVCQMVVGCSEPDNIPLISRVYSSESCGVLPLPVEFRVYVTGGDQFDQPTGGNMWHNIEWDFGDGTTEQGSLVYHEFTEAGTFEVNVTVWDKDGSTSSSHIPVTVLSDSLIVTASGEPNEGSFVTGGRDTIQLSADVLSCGFIDGDSGDSPNLDYSWQIDSGGLMSGRNPKFVFPVSDSGDEHFISVTVRDASMSITRHDTIKYIVNPPILLWLILEVDMSQVPSISPEGVFVSGSFNNWNHLQTPMSRMNGTNTWKAIIEVPWSTSHSFRFVNGLSPSGSELVPSECSSGANRREVQLEFLDLEYSTMFGECPD